MGVNGRDIAEALAAALSVAGVRTYAYLPDVFAPPGIVVGQPAMDWESDRTFCTRVWVYPITVAVSRNSDREAQSALFDVVDAIADTLSDDHDLGGLVQTSRLTTAVPTTVTANGQEFPAYELTVNILA